MAVYTDVHNYFLSNASSPWRGFGKVDEPTYNLNLPYVDGGRIYMSPGDFNGSNFISSVYASHIARQTPLVGNWILECDVHFGTKRGHLSFLLPLNEAVFAAANRRIPAVGVLHPLDAGDLLPAFLPLGRSFFGITINYLTGTFEPPTPIAFGTLNLSNHASTGDGVVSVQFIVNPANTRVAMNCWAGGTLYQSGWVSWPTGVSDWQRPMMYANFGYPAGRGPRVDNTGDPLVDWPLPEKPFCSVSTITLTDQLSDALVDIAQATGSFGEPAPTYSTLFPDATAKPSHARILRAHRSPSQAQAFHESMRRS